MPAYRVMLPVELFPGGWCVMCTDPDHAGRKCHMLEMHRQEDGTVEVIPCGCETNAPVGEPGRYVVRVTQVQRE